MTDTDRQRLAYAGPRERLRQEIRLENRKFLVQFLAAIAASMAGGAAILGLILHLTGRL